MYKILTEKEMEKAIKKAQNGDNDAQEEIIESTMCMVLRIANSYATTSTADYEDLLQAGQLGIIKAIHKYNTKKGTKFSTYAMYWIKREMVLELTNRTNFVPPTYIKSIYRAYTTLYNKGIQNINEIVDYINNNPEVLPKSTWDTCGIIDEKIIKNTIRVCSYQVSSLDESSNNNNNREKHEILSIPDKKSVEKTVENQQLNNLLIEKIRAYAQNDRNADIIIQRFGLLDGTPSTLEEIGKKYDLTRMRVGQICNSVLEKMKTDKDIKEFYVA